MMAPKKGIKKEQNDRSEHATNADPMRLTQKLISYVQCVKIHINLTVPDFRGICTG